LAAAGGGAAFGPANAAGWITGEETIGTGAVAICSCAITETWVKPNRSVIAG